MKIQGSALTGCISWLDNRNGVYDTVKNLNLLSLVAKIEYRPNNAYPYYYKPIHKLSLTPKGKEVLPL